MRSLPCSRDYELRSGKLFTCNRVAVTKSLMKEGEGARLQLQEFSDKVIDTKAAGYCVPQYGGGQGAAGQNAQMEVDSNASTPA